MAGQPNIPGFAEFDVTGIEVSWEQGTTVGNNLAILDLNEAFNITVAFAGKGTEWENMQKLGLEYNVEIFAEGIDCPLLTRTLARQRIIWFLANRRLIWWYAKYQMA